MNHTHKHDHCKHETIKFCPPCNVTYCKECGQEWGNKNYAWTYTTPNPWLTGTTGGNQYPTNGGGGNAEFLGNTNVCHDGHNGEVK